MGSVGRGDDYVLGCAGDDIVRGGGGDDILSGGEGNDSLVGGSGEDILVGGEGNDKLWGGADDDQLYGQVGDDVLKGGKGNDTLVGGEGMDALLGGAGNDTLIATEDDVLFNGGQDFDTLTVLDADGDMQVSVDLTTNNAGIEALIGESGVSTTAKISLDKILHNSQDDGDVNTVDIDNTFIAVGIDELVISASNGFKNGMGDVAAQVTDISGAEEEAYLSLAGVKASVDLVQYSFEKNGEVVNVITDAALVPDASVDLDIA